MFRFRPIRFAVFLIVAALPALATDVAVLRNGFSIRHERREFIGDMTRLYTSAKGTDFIDVPTTEIEHFEQAAPEPVRSAVAPRAAATAAPVFRLQAPARRTPVYDLNQVVAEASGRYRLDPDLVNSVIKAESGFNTRAVSPKGAQGLMQLMPGTASQLGVQNAFDAHANVDGGARYLRELLERYDFDLIKALAAYNAGPQRVEQYGGVPPYHETRAYVARIVRDFNKKKGAPPRPSTSTARAGKKVTNKSSIASAAPNRPNAQAASNISAPGPNSPRD